MSDTPDDEQRHRRPLEAVLLEQFQKAAAEQNLFNDMVVNSLTAFEERIYRLESQMSDTQTNEQRLEVDLTALSNTVSQVSTAFDALKQKDANGEQITTDDLTSFESSLGQLQSLVPAAPTGTADAGSTGAAGTDAAAGTSGGPDTGAATPADTTGGTADTKVPGANDTQSGGL